MHWALAMHWAWIFPEQRLCYATLFYRRFSQRTSIQLIHDTYSVASEPQHFHDMALLFELLSKILEAAKVP
jgi:uncharacterized membrane protein YfbV (UPF0208 family)